MRAREETLPPPPGRREVPWPRRLRSALDRSPYAWGLKSPRGLTLPHFLGIGAQKAGTTWLFHNLKSHPDLFLSRKELHYFDRPENWHAWSLEEYAGHFARAGERLRGEITPDYSALPLERIRFIRRIMPDARLLLLLRNPVDRAWSHALHSFMKTRGRAYEEVREEEFLLHFRTAGRKLGDYPAMLERWESVFPPEHLLIGFYEEVQERPRELLRRVFRHLGVTEEVDWESLPLREVSNRGPGIPLPERYREVLVELYAADVERLRARFGAPAARWLERPALSCTPSGGPEAAAPAPTR